ncbi:MAG: DUF2490 domain-containing protein [Chlamydiales bacterium]|nr:DUF2490 domain-containing protein [Chlamydiales bacterium]
MNVSIFVKATFILLLFSSCLLASSFNKENDLQLWAMQRFNLDLPSKSTFYYQTEFRWGDDISVLYLSYFQFGFLFELSKFLEIGPSYRQLSSLRRDHTRRVIHEPLFEITLKSKLREWRGENRVWILYRIPESDENEWIFRNRLRIFSPWKLGKLKFNPFIADEVFFGERRGFFENRLTLGGRFTLAKPIQSDLFYMLRHIQFPNWLPTHVVGTYLYFRF